MLIKTNLKNVGIFKDFNIQVIRKNDWRLITKSGILYLQRAFDGYIFSDNYSFIEEFLDCIYNKQFTSILVGGLGMGVAPYLCQPFCSTVDVIELDTDVIDLINTAGYMPQGVNIINDNVFTYSPQKNYDFILMDIWQKVDSSNQSEFETIAAKYTPFLTPNGVLCFPLLETT